MKKNILIILLSILVFSCSSNDDDNTAEVVNIESTLISKGNLYGDGDENISKQNIIITNQSTWNNLIAKMNTANNVSDSFSETDIDFYEYTIIAVFDEIKVNGGYSMELDITSNSKNIIISVTNIVPEGNATTVMTQPYHIVKILKSNLSILFI